MSTDGGISWTIGYVFSVLESLPIESMNTFWWEANEVLMNDEDIRDGSVGKGSNGGGSVGDHGFSLGSGKGVSDTLVTLHIANAELAPTHPICLGLALN
ncbi:hypothetical protein F2Q70_00031320 [Brassica cretica]|uniref:Uncharacterized protein n=1 Tax=Brassica cretica TaxID=69181 RepID=A0A8S9FI40_BRACR|nr:hypothetical protein F2Q70_00031320 [Brassica cretica]KAF2552137.1 hypothetical protein F2Q68_00035730 [Brassica cretica]